MIRAAAIALALALVACAGEPQIVTRDVDVAVPVACAPEIHPPAAHLARSKQELRAMLDAAPNVTERARIVSDQLLLWLGYGPPLEAAVAACKAGS